MALAPKARSFTLYEAGRDGTLFGDITIPPLPSLYTIFNTLAGSTLLSVLVEGEAEIYPPLYAREATARASIAASLSRLAVLKTRLDALEA